MALLPLVTATSGFAQTAPQTADAAAEKIEVTGTRIRAPNIEADAPVVSVTSEEFKLQGTVNVETLLNNLPQVFVDQTSTGSNGFGGEANIDLRGLGSGRTLVLLDGKRIGPGDAVGGTAVDTNFIPAPLVKSVEVLTGGASTDYGSEALAGVVNFKLTRDFQGIELDQQFGIDQHDQQNTLAQAALGRFGVATPGNQLSGFNRESTIIAGANGPDGKSNITLYLTDFHTNGTLDASRDFADCALATNGKRLNCSGSLNSPQGLFFGNVSPGADGIIRPGANTASFFGGDELTTNPNGVLGNSFLDSTFTGQPQPVYNNNPLNFLQRDDQRYTAGGFAHYEVSPHADLYTEFGFLDDKSDSQIAPGGLFFEGGPTGTVNVNCSNPFLGGATSQTALALGCGDPNFVGQNGAGPGQVAILTPGLRFGNSNPRQTINEHTDYRFVVGSRGDLIDGFTYDVSAQYWVQNSLAETNGFASFTKVQDALLVTTDANGNPVCISGNRGCVPLDIFQRGATLGAQQASVLTNTIQTGQATEFVAGTNISGDLGRWGVKSPFATNPVAVVLGVEYREDSTAFTPDQELRTADDLGGGGVVNPISGTISDQDYYGEVHAPLVENLPFAKAVNLDFGLRHSGYDIYGGNNTFDTNTYKLQGDWQVTDDIKLRGGYSRAIAAPVIGALFAAQTVNLTAGITDPCGVNPTATLAACEKTGVTPGEFGHIVDCILGQCGQLNGGNTALRPEDGDTYTWGFVATPTFLPNFNFSFDYYTIKITNQIVGGISPQIILNQCYGGGTLCQFIHRGPGGTLDSPNGFFETTDVNSGSSSTDGVDFAASYRHDLDFLTGRDLGSVAFQFSGTYLASLASTPFDGSASFDCAGLFGLTCGSPNPAWRHSLRTTWVTPWDVDLSLLWRHFSGVAFDGNSSNPLLNAGSFNTVTENISSYDYFDLSGSWQVRQNLELSAGISNIFDRDPPLVGTLQNTGNTYTTYDVLGRVAFLRAKMTF